MSPDRPPRRPLLPEVYISVDIEAAGGTPRRYSLLSLGACRVDDPGDGFYAELKPVTRDVDPEAMAVHGLSLDDLERDGLDPATAMANFADWVTAVAGTTMWPVFVGFNAPFDWMFVDDYFHRFHGRNPFGHSALDVKAFYMGLKGVAWGETSMTHITAVYGGSALTHNALHDAQDQARLFAAMLSEARTRDGDGRAEEVGT